MSSDYLKYLDKKRNNQKMKMFFLLIWSELDSKSRVCTSCGKPLGNKISTSFFDHLLEKSVNKDIRFCRDNIYLVCGNCHKKKTEGFPSERHEKAIQMVKEMDYEDLKNCSDLHERDVLDPVMEIYEDRIDELLKKLNK